MSIRTIPALPFVVAAVLCLLLMGNAPSAQARRLLVVSEPWPPYVFQKDGQLQGLDYETSLEVLRSLGFDVRFEFYPWKRCLQMVRTGQADALLDAGLTHERKAFLAFPDEPLSTSRTVLFFKVETPFTFTSYNDLAGLRVATQLGYYYTQKFMESDTFERMPANGMEGGLKMLLAGHADLAAANLYSGLYTARTLGITGRIGHTRNAISSGDNYLAFSLALGHAGLADRFSKALKEFKRTDQYAAVIERYGLGQPASP